MSLENFIPLDQLCIHYQVDMSFFTNLNEYGLIEIIHIEETNFVHKDKTSEIEKMIRMHHELNINFEGIDTIFNLLKKIESLQNQLISTQNKLKVYED